MTVKSKEEQEKFLIDTAHNAMIAKLGELGFSDTEHGLFEHFILNAKNSFSGLISIGKAGKLLDDIKNAGAGNTEFLQTKNKDGASFAEALTESYTGFFDSTDENLKKLGFTEKTFKEAEVEIGKAIKYAAMEAIEPLMKNTQGHSR